MSVKKSRCLEKDKFKTEEKIMELKQDQLTLEQKLGMCYCARPLTEEDLAFTLKLVKKRCVGSVQVPPRKPHFMKKIREVADYPVILVCDTETGFPGSDKQAVPPMTLVACDKDEIYEVFGKAIATDARKAGYNATWGPVVDVLYNGHGPISVFRKLSDDPERVGQITEIICKVYKRNGYMSCGKHYPGGKRVGGDSHMGPTKAVFTVEELRKDALVPYKYLMERDLLPSIMTTHATYENIDPENSGTMSKKVQGIIREFGWDGVCWSDSFAMMAILQKYGEEKILGLAIAAGNDIVLPNYRTPVEVSWGHLMQNYADGMISGERLEEAVRRVLKLMNDLAKTPECVDVFTQEDQELYDSIARECITAVCDEGVSPALDPNTKKLFVVMTPMNFNEEEELFETTSAQWYFPKRIADKIRTEFPDAKIEFIPEYASNKDNERVLVASSDCQDVVFVSFCETKAYLGTDCMTRRAESLINAFVRADKLAALVHFGNPFAAEPVFHNPRKIFGYTMPDSQLHAIDVLKGKCEAHGKLPFKVKLQ